MIPDLDDLMEGAHLNGSPQIEGASDALAIPNEQGSPPIPQPSNGITMSFRASSLVIRNLTDPAPFEHSSNEFVITDGRENLDSFSITQPSSALDSNPSLSCGTRDTSNPNNHLDTGENPISCPGSSDSLPETSLTQMFPVFDVRNGSEAPHSSSMSEATLLSTLTSEAETQEAPISDSRIGLALILSQVDKRPRERNCDTVESLSSSVDKSPAQGLSDQMECLVDRQISQETISTSQSGNHLQDKATSKHAEILPVKSEKLTRADDFLRESDNAYDSSSENTQMLVNDEEERISLVGKINQRNPIQCAEDLRYQKDVVNNIMLEAKSKEEGIVSLSESKPVGAICDDIRDIGPEIRNTNKDKSTSNINEVTTENNIENYMNSKRLRNITSNYDDRGSIKPTLKNISVCERTTPVFEDIMSDQELPANEHDIKSFAVHSDRIVSNPRERNKMFHDTSYQQGITATLSNFSLIGRCHQDCKSLTSEDNRGNINSEQSDASEGRKTNDMDEQCVKYVIHHVKKINREISASFRSSSQRNYLLSRQDRCKGGDLRSSSFNQRNVSTNNPPHSESKTASSLIFRRTYWDNYHEGKQANDQTSNHRVLTHNENLGNIKEFVPASRSHASLSYRKNDGNSRCYVNMEDVEELRNKGETDNNLLKLQEEAREQCCIGNRTIDVSATSDNMDNSILGRKFVLGSNTSICNIPDIPNSNLGPQLTKNKLPEVCSNPSIKSSEDSLTCLSDASTHLSLLTPLTGPSSISSSDLSILTFPSFVSMTTDEAVAIATGNSVTMGTDDPTKVNIPSESQCLDQIRLWNGSQKVYYFSYPCHVNRTKCTASVCSKFQGCISKNVDQSEQSRMGCLLKDKSSWSSERVKHCKHSHPNVYAMNLFTDS